jgi:hypothetical protein
MIGQLGTPLLQAGQDRDQKEVPAKILNHFWFQAVISFLISVSVTAVELYGGL